MRLLVTGAAGMLGQDVVAAAERAGHDVVALARRDLDITDAGSVRAAVADARPDSIVNCAAWTDVDGAEAAEAQATAVNADGVAHLAEAAASAGAHLIQVSTDYVFDGTASEPYLESSAVAPATAYGRSKLAGERRLDPRHATVVRAAWLFGAGGPNFAATMLRLASERDEVTVVDDQVGTPTYTRHLADGLVGVAEQRTTGIVHAHGPDATSWFDFACAIFEATGTDCTVRPGRSEDLGRPAPRPAYSVLGSERPDAPALPAWREGLAAYLDETRVTP